MPGRVKVFNDPVHGHIDISEVCVKIIDTPQFQRLRDIGQLGGLYYVFSGASSRRFEHSIGVSHLAKTFVERLRANQPELNITDVDVLCVEMAGLIHDLGHGPFSHMFDMKFLKHFDKFPSFEHEAASVGIFEILLAENNLMPELIKSGMSEDDVHFVKELVYGGPEEAPEGFQWRGRGEKTFLYQIVANKRNGIDVDKFDYFARDCHVLGLTKSFDCHRLMKFARVLKVHRSDEAEVCTQTSEIEAEEPSLTPTGASPIPSDIHGKGQFEICFHIKEAWNLFELFHTRYALHKRAYQHRVASAVELMVCEAMVLADPYVFLPGRNGNPVRMSDTPGDFVAYWKASDYLYKTIQHSVSEELKPARDMIQRICRRDLYSLAGEALLSPMYAQSLKQIGSKVATRTIREELVEILHVTDPHSDIGVDDLICVLVKMGYGGKGGRNPVSQLTTFFQPMKEGHVSSDRGYYEEPTPSRVQVQSQHDAGKEYLMDGGTPLFPSSQVHSQGYQAGAGKVAVNSGNRSKMAINEGYIVGVVPPDSVSRLLPKEFEETYLRVFCKSRSHLAQVKNAYEAWRGRQAEGEAHGAHGADATPSTPSKKRKVID